MNIKKLFEDVTKFIWQSSNTFFPYQLASNNVTYILIFMFQIRFYIKNSLKTCQKYFEIAFVVVKGFRIHLIYSKYEFRMRVKELVII